MRADLLGGCIVYPCNFVNPGRCSRRLGIDVEMQKLVTEEAVLEDDHPLPLETLEPVHQLRLICTTPEYGLVAVEEQDTRPSGFEQPCPCENITLRCLAMFFSYSWFRRSLAACLPQTFPRVRKLREPEPQVTPWAREARERGLKDKRLSESLGHVRRRPRRRGHHTLPRSIGGQISEAHAPCSYGRLFTRKIMFSRKGLLVVCSIVLLFGWLSSRGQVPLTRLSLQEH